MLEFCASYLSGVYKTLLFSQLSFRRNVDPCSTCQHCHIAQPLWSELFKTGFKQGVGGEGGPLVFLE